MTQILGRYADLCKEATERMQNRCITSQQEQIINEKPHTGLFFVVHFRSVVARKLTTGNTGQPLLTTRD